MSIQDTTEVVERFLAYDYGVLAANAVAEVIGMPDRAVGPEAIEAMSANFYQRVFEASAQVRNVIIGESNAVVELDFIGTHRGEFCGVPASGRQVNVPALAVYDVAAGKMTGLRFFIPVNLLLAQIRGEVSSS